MNNNIQQKDTIKASFWYLISNCVLKGLGFITIPIFARLLTKEEFGYYSNFVAWLSLLTIIVTLSLHSSLVRARFDFKDELNSYVTSNLLLGSLCTLFFFVVFHITRDFWSDVFAMDYKYLAFIFLILLFMPAYNMFQNIQRFEYKYKLVVALTIGMSVGSIALSFLLMAFMDNKLDGRILGSQLPFVIVSIGIYGYLLIKGHHVKWKYCKYALLMCLPYVIHLLASNVLNSVDRIMITDMCGATSTALYGMAYNIAMIVNVLWDSLNSAYSPWLGEQLHIKNYEGIKKYSYRYIGLFAYILVGVMLVAPEALWILGGDSYIEAKCVIPPVMLGYFFVFLYSMYVNIEQYEKKTVGMAVATIIAAVLNLVLNFIFIPKYGYIVASYTTLIGYMFLFVFHYFMVRRIKLHIVYNTKFILLICLVMVVVTVLILLMYSVPFIRYVSSLGYFIGLCFVIYKNRQFILKLVKK